jgi:multidrug efflux pump
VSAPGPEGHAGSAGHVSGGHGPKAAFTDRFVNHPILSIVIGIAIVLLGAIAFGRLPVRETPELQPPTVTVTTSWPGADPAIVETDVTEVLEREINGIAGIRTLTSTSREQISTIVVEFALDVDLETAANDVRARVARARADLPTEVEDPVVEKADADASPVLFLRLSADDRDLQELSEIAATTVRERLETIQGVSAVDIFGEQKFAIRVELDPQALASRGLALSDVEAAIRAGNARSPAGRVEGAGVDLALRLEAGLDDPDAFGDLVVGDTAAGVVHLRDVGRVRMGAENERTAARAEGIPSITVAILPQSRANILDISDELKRRLPALQADLPDDVGVELNYDRTEAVRSSIREVEETLVLGFVLVTLVIFAFLRDWRSALVPVVAIPVSIVGTFVVLLALGFSINVFTLFGLVLAIGIVVDDAIVVLENVYRWLEQGKDPLTAALEGTREIVFPVVATTVSLMVVFLPILFTGGPSGRLFLEFGTTIVASVAISAVVALTLTPMLCAVLLRPITTAGWLFRVTEPVFQAQERWFGAVMRGFVRVWPLAFVLLGGSLLGGLVGGWALPREFFPLEDRNVFFLRTQAPEGTSFPYMDARMAELETELMDAVPERKVMLTRVASGPGGVISPPNTGQFVFPLVPREERARTQQDIVKALQAKTKDVTAFQVIPVQLPTVGRGFTPPLQFVLRHPDFDELVRVLPDFLAEARKTEGLSAVNEDLRLNRPEIAVTVDRDKAAELGVSPRELARSLQILTASLELSQFERNGRQYPVLVGLLPEARATPDAVLELPVRTRAGMVPLRHLVTFTERSAASARYRVDRVPSATISANLAGITLGEGIERMREVAGRTLPDGFRTSLAGESRDFDESNQQLGFVFGLAVVLVWLVLAAQFDSFVDPLAILVSVPMALSGALLSLWVLGMTLSFFAQVGLVLLVGLVTKNGILLVEMANTLHRERGRTRWEAAAEAAQIRFRPVWMTSISTVVGAVPIALGFTSTSRAPLGVAVVGGMLVATALTLFVTPVVHAVLGTLGDRLRGGRGVVGGAVIALIALAVAPREAEAQELSELLREALDHNFDLREEAGRVEAADAVHAQAVGAVVPTVTATGSLVVGRDQRFVALGTSGPITSGAVRANVPLLAAPAWGSIHATGLRQDVAHHAEDAARERVLAEVGAAWVAWTAAERRVALVAELRARSAGLLELARDRLDVGAASPLEVTRAELQLERDTLVGLRADGDRRVAGLLLRELLGRPLDAPLDVVPAELPRPDARVDRPDALAADVAPDVAKAERTAALSGAVPTVAAFGSAGVFLIAGEDPLPTLSAGLEATAPLFAGTTRLAAARRAAADQGVAEHQRDDLRREIAAAVLAADVRAEVATESVQVATTARALAERELEQAEDRFRTGVASNVEVVDAQGRLAEAVLALVDAEAARDAALLSTWSSRGRLRDLAAPGAGR